MQQAVLVVVTVFAVVNGTWVLVHWRRMSLSTARAAGILASVAPDEPHVVEEPLLVGVGMTSRGRPRRTVAIGRTAIVIPHTEWTGQAAPIVIRRDRIESLRILHRGIGVWLHPVAPGGRVSDIGIGFPGLSAGPAQDFVGRGAGATCSSTERHLPLVVPTA